MFFLKKKIKTFQGVSTGRWKLQGPSLEFKGSLWGFGGGGDFKTFCWSLGGFRGFQGALAEFKEVYGSLRGVFWRFERHQVISRVRVRLMWNFENISRCFSRLQGVNLICSTTRNPNRWSYSCRSNDLHLNEYLNPCLVDRFSIIFRSDPLLINPGNTLESHKNSTETLLEPTWKLPWTFWGALDSWHP